ncbi:MAG: glycoside hydrolase family 57 protein [Omnitrophica WOR_2 bacterium]
MDEKGYLIIVLNTHMPYVANPAVEYPEQETWLYEAVTDCYLPLIGRLSRLVQENVQFRISLSLTPCLVDMLANPLIQERCSRYLKDRVLLAEQEMKRLGSESPLFPLARMYRDRFLSLSAIYNETWNRDLVTAFKFLKASGKVDLLASAATHAYLPLWELSPRLVNLQLKVGAQQYRHYFGGQPQGIWLPECGFYPGLDALLEANGYKYCYLDAHGVLNAYPRPRYGVYAPVHCPAGVAAFGRDWMSHDLVWLKDRGYPGDAHYLNYDRDLGRELAPDALFPFTHQNKPCETGIKYYRNGWVWGSDIYHPESALAQCNRHASDFIARCQAEVEHLYGQLGRKPVLVALFDTEHFGHWWREGPDWLDLTIRKMAYDQNTVLLTSGRDYLTAYPTNQVAMPSMSSWGYQGYSETWLMGRNHWIYPALYDAASRFEALLQRFPQPSGDIRLALNQYLRELMLAQSSDWAFILHQETAMEYATQKVRMALEQMKTIETMLGSAAPDHAWLRQARSDNGLFPDLDLLEFY